MWKPVLDLRLALLKPDPVSGRVRPDELKTAPVELCEECVAVVWSELEAVLTPKRPIEPEK